MPSRQLIAALLRGSLAARRHGQFEEARQQLDEAATLCTPDQLLERAYVLREQGELARATGDRSTAQCHYEQAVALLRAAGDPLKLAHTIRHLGDLHAEQHHQDPADACFAEALSLYRSHPSPPPLDLANAIRAYASLKSDPSLWLEAAALYESEGIAAGAEECRRRAQ